MLIINATARNGLWMVVGAAMLWGTIGIATQAIYQVEEETNSLFINLMRMLIAVPVFLLACRVTVGPAMLRIPTRDLRLMCFSGMLMAISHASYFASIRQAGVTVSTLLTICLAPVLVSAVAVLLRWEKFTLRTALALVMALSGSILLVGLQADFAPDAGRLLGVAFAVLASCTYAGTVLCGRFLANRYHPLQIISVMFAAGSFTLLLLNLLSGLTPVRTSESWGLVFYLGIFPTVVAYWLFHQGLRSVGATTASVASMLDPAVAAVLAWWLFGEALPLTGIVGAFLLLMSILLLARARIVLAKHVADAASLTG